MIDIYADESCIKKSVGSYLIISAITLERNTAKNLRKDILSLKEKVNHNYFHFCEITPHKVDNYKRLIDLFFEYYRNRISSQRGISREQHYRELSFDAFLVEHDKIDHKTYSYGDSELGFLRFYKTLLRFIVEKHYSRYQEYRVFPADLNLKKGLLKVRGISEFNRNVQGFEAVKYLINEHFEEIHSVPPPITKMKKIKASSEPLIQLTDVITGLLHCNWNQDSSIRNTKRGNAKAEVLDYFKEQCYRKKESIDIDKATYGYRSFNIWDFFKKN